MSSPKIELIRWGQVFILEVKEDERSNHSADKDKNSSAFLSNDGLPSVQTFFVALLCFELFSPKMKLLC